MSYIQSTIKCGNCGKEMNVAFGISGSTQIASWPEECPNCKSTDLNEISSGWNAKDPHTHKEEPRSWERQFEELPAINYNLYLAGTVKRADTGDYSSYQDALDELKSFIKDLLSTREKEVREETLMLITKEINIAHSDGQPTSRLTSLYNKIHEPKI